MGWRDTALLIRLPNLIIIVLTQFFTAIFLIGTEQPFYHYLTDIRLYLLAFSTVLIASAGYIINDYYDIKIDYLNKPRRVVVGKRLSRRIAMVLHWGLSALGVLVGAFLSLRLGLINLVAVFILWFYSNYLKRMPFVGNVSVALLT